MSGCGRESEEFSLSLGSEEPLVSKPGASAFCQVTSASLQFDTAIREKIRFAVTRRVGLDHVKQKVANRQDLCGLSQDWKQFKFGFDLQCPGIYKVVVMLGDQHVKNSPLRLSVTDIKTKETGSKVLEETEKVSTWLQKLHLPSETPTDPVGEEGSDVTKDQSGSKFDVKSDAANTPGETKFLKTEIKDLGQISVAVLVNRKPLSKVFSIKDGEGEGELRTPIGLCVLSNGTLVVSSTRGDQVKMFSSSGQIVRTLVLPNGGFSRPADMISLASGRFVVRDDHGLHEFALDGSFLRQVTAGQVERGTKCFGLAEDQLGRLVTVVESRASSALHFIDIEKDEMVLKTELVKDRSAGSKCRFLSHAMGYLYVTDLGLNKIYKVDSKSGETRMTIGGTSEASLNDPAGVGVDENGGLLVADSRNHKIRIFSADGRFLSNLALAPPVKRPSGVLLDVKRRHFYVLNLWGRESLVKYDLG